MEHAVQEPERKESKVVVYCIYIFLPCLAVF